MENENRAYKIAWRKLYSEVLDEKTGWGKIELRKRMDELIIQCLEECLNETKEK